MNDPRRGPRGPHGRGHGPGPGRSRMRRGALAESAMILLGEGDLHGYEMIAELEARSQGRWRPSPGALYPSLSRLQDKGLIVGTDAEGKRSYTLTDEGRAWLDRRDPDAPLPWDEADGPRRGGELKGAIAEIAGTTRQIARFGSEAQRAEALDALAATRRQLYAILAAGQADTSADPDSDFAADVETD